MNVTSILASGFAPAPLQAAATRDMSPMGFADVLAGQASPGATNLLPAVEAHSIAFDAGLLLQGPLPGASAQAGASPNEHAISGSTGNAVPASRGQTQSSLVVRANFAQTAAAATPSTPGATSPVLWSGPMTPIAPPSAAPANTLMASPVIEPVAADIGGASPVPISEGTPTPTIVDDVADLSAVPGNRLGAPAACVQSSQPAQTSNNVVVTEGETGPTIAYFAPQDTNSLFRIKAIAESLMAEYSIPVARLAYKDVLVPLVAAKGSNANG